MIDLCTCSFDSTPNIGIEEKFAISYYGVDVDDRGRAAVDLCKERSIQHHLFIYNRNEYYLDTCPTDLAKIRIQIRGAKEILVECTTLGVVEIILLLRAARLEGCRSVSLLYAEPIEYSRDPQNGLSTATRFTLTGSRQFSGVHGVALDLSLYSRGQAIFMLGYEDDRLAMLLTQQENLTGFDKHAVFGVPAFEPGWELNSFANHAAKIASDDFEVHYAGANSVAHSYATIKAIHERKSATDIPLVIAPIGTKPHAIAAALFLCAHSEHNQSALIYDHPQKKLGRSKKLRRWHVYKVQLTKN